MVLDGQCSNLECVTSGVPQGSILGPLLFIRSVNSLFQITLSREATLAVYADNIVLYRPIRCATDWSILQSDVIMVDEWAHSCGLRLRPSL